MKIFHKNMHLKMKSAKFPFCSGFNVLNVLFEIFFSSSADNMQQMSNYSTQCTSFDVAVPENEAIDFSIPAIEDSPTFWTSKTKYFDVFDPDWDSYLTHGCHFIQITGPWEMWL